MVTVVLLNFKRKENLSMIIDSLRAQTVQCEIFVWNNADEPMKDDRVDWIINSSRNYRCWPRWFTGQFASNDFIMSLDDDLHFKDPKCLEVLMKEVEDNYVEGRAFGLFGVQLNGAKMYQPTRRERKLKNWGLNPRANRHIEFPKKATYVDIIKGRTLLCNKNDMKKVPIIPEHFREADLLIGDDIAMSYYLAPGKKRHHLVTNKLNGMVENLSGARGEMALSQMGNWNEMRTNVVNFYFNR